MTDVRGVTPDDVTLLARVAGIELYAPDADGIAVQLTELRTAVMRRAGGIPADMAPAVMFDARWEG